MGTMRVALGVEYDGRDFLGWQVQKHGPSVQDCLQQAVSRVADEPLGVTACGRTDAGVHALCQVVHFDSRAERSERSWVLGINSHLPGSVSVLWARQVNESFHARFSAFARSYRYVILNRWIRPGLETGRVAWQRKPLDAERMHRAAQALLGEHDFSAFRAAHCQARHPLREVQAIAVRRERHHVILDITANGLLYHMVRNIAGSLMEVGSSEQSEEWLSQLLEQRDRALAAATAPAEGLYFVGARYAAEFSLPEEVNGFPPAWDAT